jgi:hypothetical protein
VLDKDLTIIKTTADTSAVPQVFVLLIPILQSIWFACRRAKVSLASDCQSEPQSTGVSVAGDTVDMHWLSVSYAAGAKSTVVGLTVRQWYD